MGSTESELCFYYVKLPFTYHSLKGNNTIIINKGDYDNCEDYQQNLVSLDAFKTIFGNAFG